MKAPYFVPANRNRTKDAEEREMLREILKESDEKVREFFERSKGENTANQDRPHGSKRRAFQRA
jgi:hypothetical protein